MLVRFNTLAVIGLTLVSVTLTGCVGDRISKAEDKMAEIRNQPPLPVPPPPQPQKVEDYTYAANNVRDPFIPKSLLDFQAKRSSMPSVRPNENRLKDELESYELADLTYRGRVVAPNGQQYGLVQAPDGLVRDVQIGSYMGKNHGRVVEITPTQINLIEIVEDPRLEYVEKSASLVSPD